MTAGVLCGVCCCGVANMHRQTAVNAYLSSKRLLLFVLALHARPR